MFATEEILQRLLAQALFPLPLDSSPCASPLPYHYSLSLSLARSLARSLSLSLSLLEPFLLWAAHGAAGGAAQVRSEKAAVASAN